MISLIVPIARFPFYAYTNIGNVAETCGLSLDEFDFVFLISESNRELDETFKKIDRKFRVIRSPLKTELHLKHIDWAIRNDPQLQDWIFLQHCDTFWKPHSPPWLKITKKIIERNKDLLAVTVTNMPNIFERDGTPITPMHDFAGAYNRKKIVENNWFFTWGTLGTEIVPSPTITEMIKDERILFNKYLLHRSRATPPSRKLHLGLDWLDGSECLSFELSNFPDKIARYNYEGQMIHPSWSMFRKICGMYRQGNVFRIELSYKEFTEDIDKWAAHSWISSLCFDLDESPDLVFPFKVFQDLAEQNGKTFTKEPPHPMCEILKRYARPKRTLGLDDANGITKVKLGPMEYDILSKPIIKKMIRPYDIKEPLIRIGAKNDGGYVINESLLKQVNVLYSYGGGGNEFEQEFIQRTHKPVHLYDHTIEPVVIEGLHFHQEGLSGIKTSNCDNVLNHIKINGDQDKSILLKVDVEWAEYEWLEFTPIEVLSKLVPAIVIEFHSIHESRFVKSLNEIKKFYNIIWIHGNNHGGEFEEDGYKLPKVLEMTFLRKDIEIIKKPTKGKVPLPIDRPNNPDWTDLIIDYTPKIFV